MMRQKMRAHCLDGLTLKEQRAADIRKDFAQCLGNLHHQNGIDRIDNNLGYSPGNCRWATRQQQARNTRRNIVVEFQGQKMCLVQAAELAGMTYSVAQARIARGWSPERALLQKVRK